jgi:hypothetical protein
MGGVAYINTGDWVESCTAVAEHFDGRFEILHWAKVAEVPAGHVPALELVDGIADAEAA